MRIAHLSDWHNGFLKIINEVEKVNPDIIVCTGDMVNRNTTDFSKIYILLKKLCKIAPVLYSLGNHELDNQFYNVLKRYIVKSGAILLDNEIFTFNNINFIGASLKKTCYKKNNSYKNLDKITVKDLPLLPTGYNILLAHNPLFFKTYARYGADYVLSGHVHGGLIRLPLLGGVFSPERKLFPKYYYGHYQTGKTQMNVSKGLNSHFSNKIPVIVI
ncbi:MAG: metallophosphoesterase [Oscillospiraceae bacterium]|nr:metallophosphoesterase [Oscillospiraceae bacterium]